jgi:hypothetical protein
MLMGRGSGSRSSSAARERVPLTRLRLWRKPTGAPHDKNKSLNWSLILYKKVTQKKKKQKKKKKKEFGKNLSTNL